MTSDSRPAGRTIDIREVMGKSGPKIAAFLLAPALEGDSRAFTSEEIASGLGLAHDRRQWGRNIGYVRDLLHPEILSGPLKGSTGPWRILTQAHIDWRLHGQPVTPDILRAFAGINALPEPSGEPILLENLNAEMCELLTSAERRYRSGALVRALDAITELDRMVDGTDMEMVLACKLRKLRVLHRLNHWEEFDEELRWLARLKEERQVDDDVGVALHMMLTLYRVWQQYNKVRPDSERRLETFVTFSELLDRQLLAVDRLSVLKHQIQCEVLNLSILLRRRLLCEFTEEKTEYITHPNRFDWAMEACKRSLYTIKQTLMEGDFELMGNYCANYAYLLASLHHKKIFKSPTKLWDAFRWMTVSDRIAARLGAGSDNLWSPIYWLYMRRAANDHGFTWAHISEWLKPVVHRTATKQGPRVPNPAKSRSCFSYVVSTCMRLMSAHDEYHLESEMPKYQVLMLLTELSRVVPLESIEAKFSADAYEFINSRTIIEDRDLTPSERSRLKAAKAILCGHAVA